MTALQSPSKAFRKLLRLYLAIDGLSLSALLIGRSHEHVQIGR
jgi:hypothetical protein